jgi:hypothetical protein
MQLDVVGGGGSRFESDGLADDVGHRLGFGLAHGLGGGCAPRLMVQKLMGQFVGEHGCVLGGGQVGPQGNRSAFGNAPRRGNRRGIFEPDAEGKRIGCKPLPVVAGIAPDSSDRRQGLAFGLARVKDGAWAVAQKQFLRTLRGSVFRRLLPPQDRRKDSDALFAFAYVPSELVPGVESGDLRRGGFLQHDEHDVVERVLVKAADGREILRERLAASGLECSGQFLDGLGREFGDFFGIHFSGSSSEGLGCWPLAAQSAAKKNKCPS